MEVKPKKSLDETSKHFLDIPGGEAASCSSSPSPNPIQTSANVTEIPSIPRPPDKLGVSEIVSLRKDFAKFL